MITNQTKIGEVIDARGNLLTVQLCDNVKSNSIILDGAVYKIGQVGTFLKIPLGYSMVYGVITQTGAAAIPESLKDVYAHDYEHFKNMQWVGMTLVGEQVGNIFERGISQSPTPGDSVHLVTLNDLDIIYDNQTDKNAIEVGNISISESLLAKLDLNKLLSRHFAIVGSTGSGKSNTVGVMLESIIKKNFLSSRILVIDPHGEYNSVFKKDSIVYKVRNSEEIRTKNLIVPFWALPFNELISLFSGHINDQNKDYIRQKIIELKLNTVDKQSLDIEKELITADTPIPFSIKKLWFELDDFERQTFLKDRTTRTTLVQVGNLESLVSNIYQPATIGSGEPFLNNNAKGILGFLDSMRLKLKDSRFDFLFHPAEYTPDFDGGTTKSLSDLIMSWLGSNHSITILDLSDIPSEIITSISGTLLKIIYDALFWGQNLSIGGKKQPLLIVLEEAHNYLQAGEESISSRTVQKIAKEGRKYGVGLALVTQRPSELDETVLSQCGTIIALRMNNSKDQGHIRSAIQDNLQTLTDLLPSLRTGEAIVSGEGVKIPSRIQFSKLSNAPKSSDPDVTGNWMQERITSKDEYNKLISLWQKQKLEE